MARWRRHRDKSLRPGERGFTAALLSTTSREKELGKLLRWLLSGKVILVSQRYC